LGFAINEVVHYDDVSGGCFQDAIPAGKSHEKDAFARIETHAEERKTAPIRRPGQDISGEE
jgi:hypothetical protein